MSQIPVTIEDWTIKTSRFGVQKTLKISIHNAGIFREKWSPYERNFHPRPSLQPAARKRYWKNRFRVKINGRWFAEKAKYQTFTKEEVFKKFVIKANRIEAEK